MAENTPERTRCVAHRRETGDQCKSPAILGSTVCPKHGGSAPQVRLAAEAVQIRARLEKFTEGEPLNSRLMSPVAALEWEFARIIGRIKWYDERISELAREKDLWWGLAKKEKIGAAEYTGTNRTYEARENMLLKLQNDERTRLERLSKIWIDAKFEAARLEVNGQFAGAVNRAVREVLRSLDIDEKDAEIRRKVGLAIREARPDEQKAIEAYQRQGQRS